MMQEANSMQVALTDRETKTEEISIGDDENG